jgi:small subunit ribosomal protein S15
MLCRTFSVEFAPAKSGKYLRFEESNLMSLATEKKTGVVAQFRRAANDTGSPEVQIALLSERINGLGDHFGAHKRDHASRRGLVKLVNQRRKLLDYLKATKPSKYQEVVERLGLRR